MDSQYKLLSELLSDQAAFITSPKTSLANYWGALPPCPPVSTGLAIQTHRHFSSEGYTVLTSTQGCTDSGSGDSSPENWGGGQSLFHFNAYATIFA